MHTSINFRQSNKLISAKFLGLNQYGEANIKIGTEKQVISSGAIEL